MKTIVTLILTGVTALATTACSGSSGGTPSPGSSATNGGGSSDPSTSSSPATPTGGATARTPASSPPAPRGPAYEDLSLLTQMIGSQTSDADQGLAQADALKVQSYDRGDEASLADCQALQHAASSNYPLSSYQDDPNNTTYTGVKICPDEKSTFPFESDYIERSTVALSISRQPVVNSLGVSASTVLTVSYKLMMYPTTVVRQYLFDSKTKIVEMVETRTEKQNLFFTTVSSQNKKGDVLGRIEKLWTDPATAYAWKGATTFVRADGSMNAMLVHQNDGKGVEAQMFGYVMPKDLQIQAVQVSVLDRIRALYKIGGKVVSWPPQQYGLDIVKKSGQTCGSGRIGWDSSGEAIRNFGDVNCSASMDVNQSFR